MYTLALLITLFALPVYVSVSSSFRRPLIWTKYHWRSENWQSWWEKDPVPHGYNVAKGSTHVAVTRAFVHFAVHNRTAIDLLNWMRDIRSPDEHFFPTLNHNPQLGVPGAYTGNKTCYQTKAITVHVFLITKTPIAHIFASKFNSLVIFPRESFAKWWTLYLVVVVNFQWFSWPWIHTHWNYWARFYT